MDKVFYTTMNIKILKPLKTPSEREKGRMKKNK
jgi:hypothetical protein